MGFELKENEYYLIKQMGNKRNYSFNLYNINEESIKNLVAILVSKVEVYICNDKNKTVIDKTNELGKEELNKDENKKINLYTLHFKSTNNHYMQLKNLYMYEGTLKEKEITLEMYYETMNPPQIIKFKAFKGDFKEIIYTKENTKNKIL